MASPWLPLLLALDITSVGGRPPIDAELCRLIRESSLANPLWGAQRIYGELLKLGCAVAQSTVATYMMPRGRRPGQSWRAFLRNHANGIAAIDFLMVPTAGFKLLFAWAMLCHDRRQLVSFGITAHRTAMWLSQQMTEAFPWDTAPTHLLRDRDAVYGAVFRKRLKASRPIQRSDVINALPILGGLHHQYVRS